MILGKIADIQAGLVLSRKRADTEKDIDEEYELLTLKSLSEGIFNRKYIDSFPSIEELDDRYFTQNGDVVIRLSEPNTAVFINENMEGYLVPSNFSIIRLKNNYILPQCLSLYLNSERVKNKIKLFQVGSTIRSIKKSFLSNLKIDKISSEKQRILIEISNLHLREKNLLENLINEKEKKYQGIINSIS